MRKSGMAQKPNSNLDHDLSLRPASEDAMDKAIDVLLRSIQMENPQTLSSLGSDDLQFAVMSTEALTSSVQLLVKRARHRVTEERFQGNSRLPIHRLPKELFSEVFLLCVASCRSDRWPSRWSGLYYLITDLSRVCRWWAIVIKQTPALWVRLSDTQHPDFLASITERSDQLPLNISYGSKYHNTSGWFDQKAVHLLLHFTRIVVPEAYRWQSVEICFTNTAVIQAFRQALESEIASQSLLRLKLSSRTLSWARSPSFDLFQGKAEHLLALTLEGTPIVWSRATFSSLRTLAIYSIQSGAPSVPELLDLLRNCPMLEGLHLEDVECAASTRLPIPVTHSHIESFIVHKVPALHLQVLLNNIHGLPACQYLSITCDIQSNIPRDYFSLAFGSLYHDIHRLLKNNKALPYKSIPYELLIDVTNVGSVECSTRDGSLDLRISSSLPTRRLVSWLASFLRHCVGLLPVALRLGYDHDPWDNPEMLAELDKLLIVEVFVVDMMSRYEDFLKFLGTPKIDGDRTRWRLPCLERLTLWQPHTIGALKEEWLLWMAQNRDGKPQNPQEFPRWPKKAAPFSLKIMRGGVRNPLLLQKLREIAGEMAMKSGRLRPTYRLVPRAE